MEVTVVVIIVWIKEIRGRAAAALIIYMRHAPARTYNSYWSASNNTLMHEYGNSAVRGQSYGGDVETGSALRTRALHNSSPLLFALVLGGSCRSTLSTPGRAFRAPNTSACA